MLQSRTLSSSLDSGTAAQRDEIRTAILRSTVRYTAACYEAKPMGQWSARTAWMAHTRPYGDEALQSLIVQARGALEASVE